MIAPERKRELRQIAKAKAFESGFARDFPPDLAMVHLLPVVNSPQEARYMMGFFTKYHLDYTERSRQARERNERTPA